MLDDNEHFIIMKLTSGEQVMAVLREEDEDYVLVESPMCIRMIPLLEANREHITAHPLCHFSDDKEYVLAKKDIMFIKNLHHAFVSHYIRIVEENERVNEYAPRQNRAEDLTWEEEESLEENWVTYVDGNETIN
jgi:hypothetical protein